MLPSIPNRVRQLLLVLLAIIAAPFAFLGYVLVTDGLDNPIQAVKDVQGIVDFIRGSSSHPPPGGVQVCQEAYEGPFTGYPIHCETDIGSAPIRSPAHVWCISTVRNGTHPVEIQVDFGKRSIVDSEVSGSSAAGAAYVRIDRTEIPNLPPGETLPLGRYRCRFLVGGKVEHARTFAVR
jgi:hypothetical protein